MLKEKKREGKKRSKEKAKVEHISLNHSSTTKNCTVLIMQFSQLNLVKNQNSEAFHCQKTGRLNQVSLVQLKHRRLQGHNCYYSVHEYILYQNIYSWWKTLMTMEEVFKSFLTSHNFWNTALTGLAPGICYQPPRLSG